MHAETMEIRGTAEWQLAAAAERHAAEEFANTVTHGLGLAMSLVAGAALLQSLSSLTAGVSIGCALYVASLVGVYCASFLSHAVQAPRPKRLFRILDQGFIYLLITGTYTPYALAYLAPGWWPLTAAMWAIALLGFASKVLLRHRIDAVSLVLYLALGWLPVICAKALVESAPWGCVWCIVAGGLAYSLGTVFLTLDGRYRYFHAIWHVLVMVGSACHFVGILWYVAPVAAG